MECLWYVSRGNSLCSERPWSVYGMFHGEFDVVGQIFNTLCISWCIHGCLFST